LQFSFRVLGQKFENPYTQKDFSKRDSSIKLMLAIGQASTFDQSDEQYTKYLQRLVNKGLLQSEHLSEKEVGKILDSLIIGGFCKNGGSRYKLTSEGFTLLVKDALKHRPGHTPKPTYDIQGKYSVSVEAIELIDTLDDNLADNEPTAVPPPFANERPASSFNKGQKVLLLVNQRLVVAEVAEAKTYPMSWVPGPRVVLGEEEISKREALLKRRQEVLKELKPPFGPDSEELRLKMLLNPLFQTFVPNPSPGFLKLTWREDPVGIITDMNHNYIITLDAWSHIANDLSYREAWLLSGTKEDIRRRGDLEKAIATLSCQKKLANASQ
jgi:hypothetical protein